MKLERFKEKNNKIIGVILFTIICLVLIGSVILYKTFASFEVNHHFNIINGTIEESSSVYFSFYVDNKLEKNMPQKNDGYIFDEENSYCGVLGNKDNTITVNFNEESWSVNVIGLKESRTKCNLKFVKGAYILGKPIKAITSGEGLYEVTHEEAKNLMNDGLKKSEYRYAGSNPNNYVLFNNELWRIIGLVNVITDKNTVEQRIKITKNDLYNITWSSEKINDWTQAEVMEILNTSYYNTLDKNAQNLIDENIIWNIGRSDTYNDVSANQFYERERGTITYNDEPYIWNKENSKENIFHSIGLIYASDYGYATNGNNLETRTQCLSNSLYDWYNYEYCYRNDWLWNTYYQWTMTTFKESNGVFSISSDGRINRDYNITAKDYSHITLYLKPTIKIINNDKDGSLENPYELILQS